MDLVMLRSNFPKFRNSETQHFHGYLNQRWKFDCEKNGETDFREELEGPNLRSLNWRVAGIRRPIRFVVEAESVRQPIRFVSLKPVFDELYVVERYSILISR